MIEEELKQMDKKELLGVIKAQKYEIKNKDKVINGMIDNEEKYNLEIIRLHSIIKEVREYIKNIPDDEFVESEHYTELLDILDKEK